MSLKEYIPALKYGNLLDGATEMVAGSISGTQLSTVAGAKEELVTSATIATTSNTDTYLTAPEAGTLTEAIFAGVDVLAASDTNFITWTITNLGQAGAGATAMLLATAVNTTQVTGGTALAANTLRTLSLNGTPANLVVAKNDRLRIRAAATGTLANTVTFPTYMLRFAITL